MSLKDKTPAQIRQFQILQWVRRFATPRHCNQKRLDQLRQEQAQKLASDAQAYTLRFDPDHKLRIYRRQVRVVVTPVVTIKQLTNLCARLDISALATRKLCIQLSNFSWLGAVYEESYRIAPKHRGAWVARKIRGMAA